MPKLQSSYSCSLLLAMDLLGGKWKIRILWHILEGATRFSSLRRAMPDISEKMLATQLNDLEADGILSRTIVSAKPLHIEYALAPDQQELCRALADLCEFSKNYAAKNNIALPDGACCPHEAPSGETPVRVV